MHVIHTGAETCRILLLLHHMITDNRSVSLLVREVSAEYLLAALPAMPPHHARSPLAPHRLTPPPPAPSPPARARQFADYAVWERSEHASARAREWGIEAVPTPLSWPVDRRDGERAAFHGGVVRFECDAEVGAAVQELARRLGAPPYLVVLTAFQVVLRRHVNQDRITVGLSIDTRPPEFRHSIGPFANIVPLCGDFSGRPTFRELAGQLAQLARPGKRAVPFSRLVSTLAIDRDPDRLPLCDVLVEVAESPEAELRLGQAVTEGQPIHNGATRTDLVLTLGESTPRVSGWLEYRTALFSRPHASSLLEQLATVLIAAHQAPDVPVRELPLQSADRIRAQLAELDQIAAAEPPRQPVQSLVRDQAARDPEAIAVEAGGDALSYRELSAQAAVVATALRALDVDAAHTPVAIQIKPGAQQAAALLGALDAGGHVVCFGPGDSGERARAMLTDLQPACLIVDADPAADSLAAWWRAEGRVLDLSRLPGQLANPAASPEAHPADLDGLAYVTHTSGSTGKPKAIAMSHASLAQFVTWMADQCEIAPGSRVAQWAAPGYDASLVEIFMTLCAGATLCPAPTAIRAHPEKILDWLVEERITLFQTVPSFARELHRQILRRGRAGSLRGLRHLLLAGESLPADLANQLRDTLPSTRLVNLYGSTESILASWHEVTGPEHGRTPIGRPIPGRQILLLDDQDRPCPPGLVGNVVVRSPYLAAGYLNLPDAQQSAFQPVAGLRTYGVGPGRWYRTGDLGRRRADGLLEFHGRRDLQIKFYGTRLELTEVEAVLAAHPAVRECAVLASADRDGLTTRLTAYVAPRDPTADGAVLGDGSVSGGGAELEAVLRRQLRSRFGAALLPVSFRTVRQLPRNAGGKIDRGALTRPHRVDVGTRELSGEEHVVAGIWQEVLSGPAGARPAAKPALPEAAASKAAASKAAASKAVVPEPVVPKPAVLQGEARRIGPDDSFFSVGGHSVLIPVLLHRVRLRFGIQIPIRDFMVNPTVAGVAGVLARRQAAAEQALVIGPSGREVADSFGEP